MKRLAIITARGGSKRIPRKNIKNFLGQPILKYSIDAALESGYFAEVMVSTDDIEIAEIAKKYGASVPFMRSEATSNDYATTADVLSEVINQYISRGQDFDNFCCIYPTAPFVNAEKLKKAIDLLESTGANSVLPVTKFSFPILRSLKIENGIAKFNWPEYLSTRSQDLPAAYHDCGQFYVLNTDKFLGSKKIFTDFTVPIEMPESEVQDIDNEEDWKIAEIKYTFLLEKMNKQ
jgi:pseudaminic acid cytidylyltransferase